jgi:hypothetical protein
MNFLKGIREVAYFCFWSTIIFIVASCGDVLNQDDYKLRSVEATPTLSVPLAFGDLSIADILSESDSQYIKVYSDGLVYLEYDQVLKSQAIRDLVSVPDKNGVTASLSVPSGAGGPVANDYNSTQFSQYVFFDTSPEQLTEILLKGGVLNCDVTISPANANFKYAVNITIPEFTNAGAPFSIDAASTTGQSFSLDNYLFQTPVPNRITVNYTLIVKSNPNTFVIAPGTKANITISFKDMGYKYATGFFADQIADLPGDTLNIEAFGNSLLDVKNLSFAQPKIEFKLVNDVGVPTKVNFISLAAHKPGASLPIQISPASPVYIAFPTVMGDSATTIVSVTNASALVNFAPTQFYYKTNARINENLSSGVNFVTDTSLLRLHLHVELPLYGHASNIKLYDTLDIGLSDADRSEIIDAALKIKTTNQIPLLANIQFYLTDSSFHVQDSLLLPSQTDLIKNSQVDNAGELLAEGVIDTKIPLSKDKLQKLFHASKLIIKAVLNTSQDSNGNYPDVKFKSAYKMGIKLGLDVNAKLKIKL